MDFLEKSIDKQKYQECEKNYKQKKMDTKIITLNECSNIKNQFLKTINELQSEKFILQDKLNNELKLREIMYKDNYYKETEYTNKVERYQREIISTRDECKYQRIQKIKARKQYHQTNILYKKSLYNYSKLETKIDNIMKRLKGLSNKKLKNNNLFNYFADFFPEENYDICELCCCKHKTHLNCQNEKCNIKLCESCVDKIDNKCPYCQCNWKKIEIKNQEIQEEEDDEDTQEYIGDDEDTQEYIDDEDDEDYIDDEEETQEDDDEDDYESYEGELEIEFYQSYNTNNIPNELVINQSIQNMFNETDEEEEEEDLNMNSQIPLVEFLLLEQSNNTTTETENIIEEV